MNLPPAKPCWRIEMGEIVSRASMKERDKKEEVIPVQRFLTGKRAQTVVSRFFFSLSFEIGGGDKVAWVRFLGAAISPQSLPSTAKKSSILYDWGHKNLWFG